MGGVHLECGLLAWRNVAAIGGEEEMSDAMDGDLQTSPTKLKRNEKFHICKKFLPVVLFSLRNKRADG